MDLDQVFGILLGATIAFVGSTIGSRQAERRSKRHHTLQRLHEDLIPKAWEELSYQRSIGSFHPEFAAVDEIESVEEIHRLSAYLDDSFQTMDLKLWLAELARQLERDKVKDTWDLEIVLDIGGLPQVYDEACSGVREELKGLAKAVEDVLRKKYRSKRPF